MKTIIIAILGLSSFAFAGQENQGIGHVAYNPQEIYDALTVSAVAENPGIAGVYRYVKSVGGLTCEKALMATQISPSYTCEIDQQTEDFGAIYNSLSVEAIQENPGFVGVYRAKKSVGGLTCESSKIVVPGAVVKYTCEMSEN